MRSIKRIDKLKFYKNLGENEWENCIDGIVRKPGEVVRALMEYKLDSRKINNAISYGTNSEEIKSQIKAIEKFLDKQSLKHDMEVYRGEKELGIFKSIKLGNTTLKDKLDEFALKLETCNITQDEVDKFVDKYLSGKKVKQERFLSTSIEKEAGDMYAKKVLWRIFVPAKTKALMIESYNVERLSEAELLLQKGSNLLIENAKYDKLKKRWVINASVELLY